MHARGPALFYGRGGKVGSERHPQINSSAELVSRSVFSAASEKRVGKDTGLEALEQICAVERMMTAVREAWEASGESLLAERLGPRH